MINQISNSIVGKHKIPRYIYHLTNRANYESMLQDKFIKTSKDLLIEKGVFAVELTNLLKHWQSYSLQQQLLKYVAKGQDEVVILKIPTAKLDPDKLIIRSQKRLFDWGCSVDGAAAIEKADTAMEKETGQHKWLEKYREIFKGIVLQDFAQHKSEETITHLIKGAPAKMSGLFEQRKEPIEYVYLDNIPMSKVEKIGETNIAELRKSADFDLCRPMKSIFTKLLQGTPEARGAELLDC